MAAKVRTCLWFDGRVEEAADFYVSLLPDSRVEWISPYRRDDEPLVIEFTLAGAPYMLLNGGSHFRLNEAASISVMTRDQAETDRLWDLLASGGGRESRCGWLVDRFGVSWQIVPEILPRLLADPDKAASARVMEAIMTMGKIDIAALEAAHHG